MRRLRKRYILWLLGLCCICGVLLLLLNVAGNRCHSGKVVSELCEAWDNEDVDGDWCFQICRQAKVSCASSVHYGKEVVLQVEGPFGKAIAKSKWEKWAKETEPPLDGIRPREDFEDRIRTYIANVINWKEDNRIWDILSFSTLSSASQAHILQLFTQREFVYTFLFTHGLISSSQVSPSATLLGRCGHLYVVEKTQSDLSEAVAWPARERLHLATVILQVIMQLDEMELSMCDMKWEHFGMSFNSSDHEPSMVLIKLLDLDALLSKWSIKINMDHQKCSSQDLCDYFDCKGECVQNEAGVVPPFCRKTTGDSNLSRLIRLILLPRLLPPQRGLLHSIADPPLTRYLNQCLDNHCDSYILQRLLNNAMANA